MARLVFTLLHGPWTVDSAGTFHEEETAVEDATAELIRLAGSAHAAGAIRVTEGLDVSHVQTQKEGEAEHARAQFDGRWQEGNQLQHQTAQSLAGAGVAVDVEATRGETV